LLTSRVNRLAFVGEMGTRSTLESRPVGVEVTLDAQRG
jgi:hypothetical protein